MEIIELSIDLVTEIITKQMNSVCMCVCACVLLARRRCLVGKEKRLRNDHKFGETHNQPSQRWEMLQGELSESHRK